MDPLAQCSTKHIGELRCEGKTGLMEAGPERWSGRAISSVYSACVPFNLTEYLEGDFHNFKYKNSGMVKYLSTE